MHIKIILQGIIFILIEFAIPSICIAQKVLASPTVKGNKTVIGTDTLIKKNTSAIEYDKKAETAFKNGQFAEAEKINKQLLFICKNFTNKLLYINANNREGLIFLERGKHKEAENSFNEALKFCKDYPQKIGEVNSNLGTLYLALGNKDKAIEYFFAALNIYEINKNMQGAGETNSNISSTYYLMGKTDEAIEYQKKSIALREKIKDKEGLVITNINLGQLYILKGNYDLSLTHISSALKYSEELKNKKLIASAYAAMSVYNVRSKNFAEALKFQTKAISIFEEIDDKIMLSRLYVSAGNLANTNKDSVLAISYFEKAMNISVNLKNKENISNVFEKLSSFYASKNDFAKAFSNYKSYIIYKDSISAKSNISKIEEIKTKYETEKKDNEILKLQNEQQIKTLQIEKQNALINGNIQLAKKKEAEILLLSKASIILKQQGDLQVLTISKKNEEIYKQTLVAENRKQQLKLNETERLVKENELQIQKKVKNFLIAGLFLVLLLALLFINQLKLKKKFEQQKALLQMRNSISKDLHDEIGSTLTSISILSNVSEQALDKQPAQAKEMIHQIAMQSKTIQQNMSDIVWSIRPENESVDNLTTRIREYAAQTLEKLNIAITITVDDNIVAQKLPMQYRKEILLICKEAINNIAKHSGANKATIELKKLQETIILSIQDNGTWKGNSSGSGTKTMKERAETIGGNLKIENTNNSTNIVATIPIP